MDTLAGLIGGGEREVRMLSWDMYLHDPVSGSVVDLVSQLPFGDFSISGVPEIEMLEIYRRCAERLRVKSLMPSLSVSYQVMGAFLGVLSYDEQDRIFDGIMPQSLDNAVITPVPVYGHNPIIDLKISKEIEQVLKLMSDPRAKSFLGQLPKIIQRAGQEGRIPLQPENTLYIPRKTKADEFLGVSVYRRLIPIFLLEKALTRGTIELAYRRQRGILHAMAGDDLWMPTNEELRELADLITGADQDPVGAIIATRPGIQFQEILQGGDFWKWTDVIDILNAQKFRALGVSEALISGETTVQGTEAGMSVFVQQMRLFREYLTRTIFYERIFPYLAVVHDFKKHSREVYGRAGPKIFGSAETGYTVLCDSDAPHPTLDGINVDEFHIPVISWHSQMRPEGDANYMEMLNQMSQHGIPIPLRMLAASCGVNLQDILFGMDEDLEVRKKIQNYAQKVAALMPQQQEGEEGGYGGQQGYYQGASGERRMTEIVASLLSEETKPKSPFSRDFGEMAQRMNPNVGGGGKRIFSTERGYREREEEANRKIAEAAANVAQQVNTADRLGVPYHTNRAARGGMYGMIS